MNIELFNKYCERCDQILNNSSVNDFVFINSLNPVRPGKKTSKQAESHLKDISFIRFCKSILINHIVYFTRICYSFIFDYINSPFPKEQDKNKVDIIILSHLLNANLINPEDDLYFGSFIKKLKNHKKIYLVQINWTKLNNRKLFNYFKKNNFREKRFIIGKSLNFINEIKLYFKLVNTFFKLLKSSLKFEENLKNQIYHHLNDIFQPASIQSLRIATTIEIILKKLKPKYLITTFEGHSWERLVYYNAKKNNPNIKCIGYLHAGLFKNQHSIKRIFKDKQYNPNIVLTCGKNSFEVLKDNFYRSDISLIIIGCSRAINRDYKFCNKILSKSFSILVLPDGDMTEISSFLLFIESCLIIQPSFKFIIKLHPNTCIDKIKSKFSKILINKLEFTKSTIKENSKKADYVLYKSTTAVIEAISYGLLPIYFDNNKEPYLDFIYYLKNFDRSINYPNDLITKIKSYQDYNDIKKLIYENISYANYIFSEFEDKKLTNLFK